MKKQELIDTFSTIAKWSNWLGVAGYRFKRQDIWRGDPASIFKKDGTDYLLLLNTTIRGDLRLVVINVNKNSSVVFNADPDFVREWKTPDELEPAVKQALNKLRDIRRIV